MLNWVRHGDCSDCEADPPPPGFQAGAMEVNSLQPNIFHPPIPDLSHPQYVKTSKVGHVRSVNSTGFIEHSIFIPERH